MHGGDIYRNDIEHDFSVNINPFGTPEEVRNALYAAVERVENYPDIRTQKLRRALADKLSVNEESIIFGNGASELFNAITLALRPKKTLIVEPAFTGYERAAKAAESEIVRYALSEENGFKADEKIPDAITQDMDLLFIASPNNPTGKLLGRELTEKILDKCLKYSLTVVLDECFMTLSGRAEAESFINRLDEYPNLCVVRSFTKTYAIPGVRLGYMLSSNEELRGKINSCLSEWNISVFAEKAGLAALREDEYLSKSTDFIAKERTVLIAELRKIGYNVFDSDSDFILFRAERGLDKKLLQKKILIRNCSDFFALSENYYRIAVKSHLENGLLIKHMDLRES